MTEQITYPNTQIPNAQSQSQYPNRRTTKEHRSEKRVNSSSSNKRPKEKKRCHLQYQNFLLLRLVYVPLCGSLTVSCMSLCFVCLSVTNQFTLHKRINPLFFRLCRQLGVCVVPCGVNWWLILIGWTKNYCSYYSWLGWLMGLWGTRCLWLTSSRRGWSAWAGWLLSHNCYLLLPHALKS